MKIFFLDFKKTRHFLAFATLLVGVGVVFAGLMLNANSRAVPNDLDPIATVPSPVVIAKPVTVTPEPKSFSSQGTVVNPKTKLHAIYKVKTERKVVALTFDISWGTKVPGPVMDILKKYGVKSTFFLSGPWASKYPEFPQRLVQEGHEVASHGNRHIDLDRESRETVREEILAAHRSLKKVTGLEANLIRTPNGAFNNMVLEVADQSGYKVIQWSADSLDWKKPGVDAIVNRVMDKVHPGAIILMHASDTCLQTPEALPRVLDGLKAKGYELVTVSKLLEEGPGVVN